MAESVPVGDAVRDGFVKATIVSLPGDDHVLAEHEDEAVD